MSRIDRRNWTAGNIGYKSSGGLMDIFDNSVKIIFRIDDKEFDLLAESMTDEEVDLMMTEAQSFAERRKMIQILNKYINYGTSGSHVSHDKHLS